MSGATFERVLCPGTIPNDASRGPARVPVFCKVTFSAEGRLSVTGVVGPRSNGDAWGSSGQIGMGFSRRNPADNDRRYGDALVTPADFVFDAGWDAELWLDFLEVWERWHLNDMRAACEHQRDLGWLEAAREERTLYHWRLSAAVSSFVRSEVKAAEGLLVAGETVTLEPETARLAALPARVTTSTDAEPSSEYVPNGPAYAGDHYNRPSEVKTRGWLRPDEHPDGLLTAPCPECGYRYGSEWRREEVPADVLAFLQGLPRALRVPAWV